MPPGAADDARRHTIRFDTRPARLRGRYQGGRVGHRLAQDEQDIVGQFAARVLDQQPGHPLDRAVQMGQGQVWQGEVGRGQVGQRQGRRHAIAEVKEAAGPVPGLDQDGGAPAAEYGAMTSGRPGRLYREKPAGGPGGPRRRTLMSKIVAGITTSVDGYITGPDDGPGCGLGVGGERLHYWVFGGPWSYESPGRGEATGEDQAYIEETMGDNGAVIAGRGTYEAAGHWGDA